MGDIVNTAIPADSKLTETYVTALQERYPFLELASIGHSVQGKPLHALRLGAGEQKVLYVGTHHSLEWITTLLLLKFAEEYCAGYESGQNVGCYDIGYLFETRTILLVPMLNPDGVDMVLSGRLEYAEWQANARGVDLNHNYNAMWNQSKLMERDYGVIGPGPTRYGGKRPESEPETGALCTLCRGLDLKLALALHSQGEEIYYDFGGFTPKCSLAMAEIFSTVTGYKISTPEGIASYAGFKDWFIYELNRPAFTIEVGLGKNPLPIGDFDGIYQKVRELLFTASLV